MNKDDKREEFFEALKKIKKHMNWCKIKLNPDNKEDIKDSRIQYDWLYYMGSWKWFNYG